MGMFDDLIPRQGEQSGAAPTASGAFDDLIPGSVSKKRVADVDYVSTAEGQRLSAELRNKADRMLLEGTGVGPGLAALFAAGETLGLNAPRNIAAGIRSVLPGGKSFEQENQYLKDIEEAAARQYPVITGGSSVAGALGAAAALPVAPAASLVGRALQGAGMGAVAGGVSQGLGEHDLSEAIEGAKIGALVGGLAPPALEGMFGGAGAVGRGVANLVRPVSNPEAEAGRRVASAISRDAAIGANPLDESVMATAQARGQPVVVGDLGGKTTEALARSAANTSPEARHALEMATRNRFESQAPRVAEFLHDLGSGEEIGATREALREAARQANKPLYRRAYDQGRKGIWTPELERLSASPDVLSAMKSAAITGKSRAINEGFGAFNPGVIVTDDGRVLFQKGAKGVPTYPDLQYWDYVKRELDDSARAAGRAGRTEESSRLGGQARSLREELDRVVPSYSEARQGAAAFFDAQDALEAGQKFVSAKGQNADYRRAIAKMSEPERKLFADGFTSQLAQTINESGDRRSILNSVFHSPNSRERVFMALGHERATEFEAFMRVEGMMDRLRNAVSGNSTTVRQLMESSLAGGIAGGVVGGGDPRNISLGAVLGAAARTGKLKIDQRVAQRVGEMLASPDPEIYRKAIKLAARNKPIMDFMKQFDARLGAAMGEVASDRDQRASGGRIAKRDYPAKRADKLGRQLLREKFEHDESLRPLMSAPDGQIADALRVAKHRGG